MSSILGNVVSLQKRNFIGVRYTQERFEFRTPLQEKVSIACLSSIQGESLDEEKIRSLGFWKKLFWIPIKIKSKDGADRYVLLNKSSLYKHLKTLGLSKKDILESITNDTLIAKIVDSYSKIAHKKIAASQVLRFSQQARLNQALGIIFDIENRLLHPLISEVLSTKTPGYDAASNRVIRECGFSGSTTVIFEYDEIKQKRIYKFGTADTEVVLFEIDDTAFGAHIEKISSLLGKPGFNLTETEASRIINFLNHKLISPQRIQFPCEFKKSITGLARSILIRENGEILVCGSKKRGDQIIGEGGMKSVKHVYSTSGKCLACFNHAKKRVQLDRDPAQRHFVETEKALRKQFPKTSGILSSIGEIGSKIVDEKYDGSLEDVSALSFQNRFSLLKDIFQGLKNIHTKGYIHKDIKPANIFFKKKSDGNYEAAIADFGLTIEKARKDQFISILHYYSEDFIPPEYERATRGGNGKELLDSITEAYDIYATGKTLAHLFKSFIPTSTFATASPIPDEFRVHVPVLRDLISRMSDDDLEDRATWPDIISELAKMGITLD